MIRNHLVCGIRDGNMRTRLLQQANLSPQIAVETATRAESAVRHVKEMTADVNFIHSLSNSNTHADFSS